MYCSSCGSSVAPGLSYCNRCGAELNAKPSSKKDKASELVESLVWAIVVVSLGGLGLLIGLMAVMKNELHFDNRMILLLSLMTFVLIMSADIVFVWLLLRSRTAFTGNEREAVDTAQVAGPATKELAEPQERLIAGPAVSVTENTTRTLEPVYRERKTD